MAPVTNFVVAHTGMASALASAIDALATAVTMAKYTVGWIGQLETAWPSETTRIIKEPKTQVTATQSAVKPTKGRVWKILGSQVFCGWCNSFALCEDAACGLDGAFSRVGVLTVLESLSLEVPGAVFAPGVFKSVIYACAIVCVA